MKKALLLPISFLISTACLIAQYTDWKQYTIFGPAFELKSQGPYIYAATEYSGLMRINVETDETFFFNNTNSGIPYNTVTAVLPEADGQLWIATTEHWQGLALSHFDGSTWQTYTPENSPLPVGYIRGLARTQDGSLWASMQADGLMVFSNGNWTHYTTENSALPANYSNGTILAEGDSVWVGTANGLALIYDGEWEIFNSQDWQLPSNSVGSILKGMDGALWITLGNGLARLIDGDWMAWNNSTFTNILQSSSPVDLAMDQEGGIMISLSTGTWGLPAVARYYNNEFTAFATDAYDPDYPSSMLIAMDANNDLWAFHQWGMMLRYLNPGWEARQNSNTGISPPSTRVLANDLDGKAVLGDGNIMTFDGSEFSPLPLPIADIPVVSRRLLAHHDGTIWTLLLGDSNVPLGLASYDGVNTTVHNYATSGFPPTNVLAMDFDSDNLPYALTPFGLYSYDGATWNNLGTGDAQYFLDFSARIVIDAEDAVWIDSSTGLYRYDGQWEHFDTSNSSLPFYIAYLMGVDTAGRIWIATADGTSSTSSRALVSYHNGDWEVFTTDNSDLPTDRISCGAAAPDGSMWFGTWPSGSHEGGLMHFDGSVWTTYHSGNSGVMHQLVRSISIDLEGRVYAVGQYGLSVYDPQGTLSAQHLQPLRPNSGIQISSYPNPGSSIIRTQCLSANGDIVNLHLYDISGKRLQTLANALRLVSGQVYNFDWDVSTVPEGIYVVQAIGANESTSHKLIVTR